MVYISFHFMQISQFQCVIHSGVIYIKFVLTAQVYMYTYIACISMN